MKRALLLFTFLTIGGISFILNLIMVGPYEIKGHKTTGVVKEYIREAGSRTTWRPVIELTRGEKPVQVASREAWRSKWYDVGETVPVLELPSKAPLVGSFICRWSFGFSMLLVFLFSLFQILKTLSAGKVAGRTAP
jgi:hypothetical protein